MSEQNGSAPVETPAATDEPCVDCASNGEKVLAVLGLVFAVLVAVMAVDMFTGGRVTGYVTAQRGGGSD